MGDAKRLRQVMQPVTDMVRARAFYGEVLRLPLTADYGPLVFFDLGGGMRLLLETNDGGPSGSILYLAVEGIEDRTKELDAAGVEIVAAPHRIFVDEAGTFGPAGEEEWMAFFKDSEGNTLAFVERRLTAEGA